ncbi:MAG: hypothetical protein P4L63_00735 [Candidatus Pacebacteria bacterium]|nr:hypothetical protein [Candidatus Paceibacterota bacterium]
MTTNIKKVVKIIGLSIFFLLIIIYAIFRSKDLILGVKIRNVEINGAPIQDGATITSNSIEITGVARNAVDLTLDGREISIDQAGDFDETIALLTGYNIINLRAQDKFGKVDEKNYQLMH